MGVEQAGRAVGKFAKHLARKAKALGFHTDPKDRVYHVTATDFDEFDPDRAIGTQFWSTTDKAAAEAGEVGAQGKGVIKELVHNVKNPAGWDEYDKFGIDELIAKGYDGVKLPEADGNYTLIAFKPSQYRSINAAFDPAKKNSGNLLAGGAGAAVIGGAVSQNTEAAEVEPLDKANKLEQLYNLYKQKGDKQGQLKVLQAMKQMEAEVMQPPQIPAPGAQFAGMGSAGFGTPADPVIAQNAMNVVGEGAASANRATLGGFDFLANALNVVPQMAGSDARIPRLEAGAAQLGATQGNFMQPGIARDAVQAGGMLLPAVAGMTPVAGRNLAKPGELIKEVTGFGSATAAQPMRTGAEMTGLDIINQPQATKETQRRMALQSGRGEEVTAGYKLTKAGEVVVDPVQRHAQKAHVPDATISFMTSSDAPTKTSMGKMLGYVKKGRTDLRFRELNPPQQVIGEAIESRLKVIIPKNKAAGVAIDKVAEGLKGKPIGLHQAKNEFIEALGKHRISVNGVLPDHQVNSALIETASELPHSDLVPSAFNLNRLMLDRVSMLDESVQPAYRAMVKDKSVKKALLNYWGNPTEANYESLKSIGAAGDLVFEGSSIESVPKARRIISDVWDIIKDPSNRADAADAHFIKRQIDELVYKGKADSGLSGTMQGVLKKLRGAINTELQNTYPRYKTVNKAYSDTIRVIDNIQSLAGSKIDLTGDNVALSVSSMSRKVLSNYNVKGPVMDALTSLDEVAKEYGKKASGISDNLIDLTIFDAKLREIFPTAAPSNTFQKSIGTEALRAAEAAVDMSQGGVMGTVKGAAKIVKDKFTIDHEKQLRALEALSR